VKRGGYLKRNTRLTRGKPLKSGGRLPPVNRKRAAAAKLANFGPPARIRWFHAKACLCGGAHPACRGRTVCAHTTSRGAGGNAGDIVPLSWFCHEWQGQHGWADWHRRAGLPEGFAYLEAARLARLGPDAPKLARQPTSG
jgi:hypothetical protein